MRIDTYWGYGCTKALAGALSTLFEEPLLSSLTQHFLDSVLGDLYDLFK